MALNGQRLCGIRALDRELIRCGLRQWPCRILDPHKVESSDMRSVPISLPPFSPLVVGMILVYGRALGANINSCQQPQFERPFV